MQGRKPDYCTGQRRAVTELLLTVGVLPQKGLFLLGNGYICAKLLRKMIDEGVVREVVVRKKHIFVFNDFENTCDIYLNQYRAGCYVYYNLFAKINAKDIGRNTRKEISKVSRAYRQGLTEEMMYGAGIRCTSNQRPQPAMMSEFSEPPYYFSSLEVRGKKQDNSVATQPKVIDEVYREDEEEDEDTGIIKHISTRSMGVLYSRGGLYVVYNLGSRNIWWSDRAEMSFCSYAFSVGYVKKLYQKDNKSRSLFFYQREKQLRDILMGDVNKSYFSLNSTDYDRLYAIPYSLDGRELVKEMTCPGWEKRRIETVCTLMELDLNFDVSRLSLDCDGFDDDNYYYFLTSCELKRLSRFVKSSIFDINKNKTYVIYCFEWQYKPVKEYVKNQAVVKVIPFVMYSKFLDYIKNEE